MQPHSAQHRRALIPTEDLGPPGWMLEMSSFDVWAVTVAGTTSIENTAVFFFAMESLGPAFLTVHSHTKEKRLPFLPPAAMHCLQSSERCGNLTSHL